MVELEIIKELLDIKGKSQIEIDKLDKIFNLRLAGEIKYLSDNNKIIISKDFSTILDKISKVNYQRNLCVLDEIKRIDLYLNDNRIKRLWIKGIRDLKIYKELIGLRKMVDADILVEKNEDIKNHVKKYGMIQGVLGRNGELILPNSEEDIFDAEKNHYEYVPFVKKIRIQKIITYDLPSEILSRYRIFKDEDGFYTDLTLDIHHALAEGINYKIGIKDNCIMPLMNDIDDMWYCMNKCYYEVFRGKSKDLQVIFNTLRKVTTSSLKVEKVEERFKEIYPRFYNENVFKFFSGLINNNEEVVNKLIDVLKKKI